MSTERNGSHHHVIIIDDEDDEQTPILPDNTGNIIHENNKTSGIVSTNKIEKRKKMMEKRKSKIKQIKNLWKAQNRRMEESFESCQAVSTETTASSNITKEDLKNVMSSLLEGTVMQMMKAMQEEICSLKEQQVAMLSLSKSETHHTSNSSIITNPSTPQPSTSTSPSGHYSSKTHQQPPHHQTLFSQPKHHGSVDKDCWVIWNNAIYDKLKLLRRMKTIKYHEWEDFVERDALIWRRHFELKEQFKTSDKKQHYTQHVDYISPVMHAKEFLGKTLQKIREGSFKDKEVSQDMLKKILDGVSKEGNIGPFQQDMLKKKEITPKSKINSPFWWLNLDIYRQLSVLVEMKIVSRTDWNNYMKKVMQLNDSILVETDRAQKIITFGEGLMKTTKEKTPTDKWFQFLQKKRMGE